MNGQPSRRQQAFLAEANRVVDALSYVVKRYADLESMQLAAKQSADQVKTSGTRTAWHLDETAGAAFRQLVSDLEGQLRAMERRLAHDVSVAEGWVSEVSKVLHTGPSAVVMFGTELAAGEHARLLAAQARRVVSGEGGSYRPVERQRRPPGEKGPRL